MPNQFNIPELVKQNLGRYLYRRDDTTLGVLIEGWAQRGVLPSEEAWLLKRTMNDSGIVSVEYADDGHFSQEWDERTSSFGAVPSTAQALGDKVILWDGENSAGIDAATGGIKTTETVVLSSTLERKTTTVTTSSTKISTPEDTGDFVVYHTAEGEQLYLGDSSITAVGMPLEAYEIAVFDDFNKDDGNDVYGIASSSITVYCEGGIE